MREKKCKKAKKQKDKYADDELQPKAGGEILISFGDFLGEEIDECRRNAQVSQTIDDGREGGEGRVDPEVHRPQATG